MAKITGNELDLYAKMREIAVAHSHTNIYQQINCFALGYAEDLNADNLDKVSGDPYFYSKQYSDNGGTLTKDFPMCFAFVPRGVVNSLRPAKRAKQEYSMDVLFLDLFGRDRDGDSGTTYAQRMEEQIWAHTNQMGREYLAELGKYVGIGDGIQVDRVPKEAMSGKYCGTMFRITITLEACDDNEGTFSYG